MNFTVIYHDARKRLGLTCNEYCVADMVSIYADNPSNPVPGWCFASRQAMAEDMGVSKVSMVALVEKCIQAGVLEKNPVNGNLRITQKFYDEVHLSKRIYEEGKESLPSVKKVNRQDSLPPVKNLNQPGKESLPTVGKESLPYINELEIKELNKENTPADAGLRTDGLEEKCNGTVQKNAPLTDDYPFEAFWQLYPKKEDKKKCAARWAGLPAAVRGQIMAHAPRYVEKLRAAGKLDFIRNPLTYLNAEDYKHGEDLAPVAARPAPVPGNAASHFNPYQQTR